MSIESVTEAGLDDGARLDVAVIAVAGRFPGARTVAQFWHNLLDRRSGIRRFSPDELAACGVPKRRIEDPAFVPAAPALLDHPGMFDAEFFGYSPREAELLDPQHRLFLECAWEAIESAGYAPDRVPGSVGVYASSSISAYLLFNLLTHPELSDQTEAARAMFGNDKDFVGTRVSYDLNLRGPSLSIQTACSSSLVAIHTACQSLITHDCDMALAGGVSVHMPQRTGYDFIEGGYHSPDGCSRPYDARSQGTVFGSGAGIVVLKRLEDARADRDTILAVVRGTAINNDGSGKVGFTAPSIAGQAEVIARAHSMAGITADTVGYVEGHGTATALGDLVEVSALRQAFAGASVAGRCALGSVKSCIGHLDAAAGVAGFITAVLAVRHGVIPPTLNFETPNPRLELEGSPFYVTATPVEWNARPHRRRAGVSSFGIGGTNAHVIVEEPPPVSATVASRSPVLLALSAKTPDALARASTDLAEYLERHDDVNLADASFTLLTGRKSFPFRWATVCGDRESAVQRLRDADRMTPASNAEGAPRSVAFLFPGGGAQHPLMAAETYRSERAFRDEIDKCAARLQPLLGIDLRRLLYPQPAEVDAARRRLQDAHVGLPALLTLEYALARLWMSWGVTPSALLGHSLGEYAAALIAGVFSLEDALEVVAWRGALLDRLPPGAMLSVPCSPGEIEPYLHDDLSIASVNGPAQCVVSGAIGTIDRFAGDLSARGIESRRLHIRTAGHSPSVEPILREFGDRISAVHLRAPQIPYVSCVTGDWVRDQDACSPQYWVDHLRSTVQFSRAIGSLLRMPRQVLLEVGPGQVLTSLVRLSVPQDARDTAPVVVASLPHAMELEPDLGFIVGAAGKLWAAGVQVDWSRFFGSERRTRIPLPTYPLERRRYWLEPRTPVASRRIGADAKNPDVDEWFHAPTWKREPLSEGAASRTVRACLLLTDDGVIAEAVRAALVRMDVAVVSVRPADRFTMIAPDSFGVRSAHLDDYQQMLRRLENAGTSPDTVMHLWTLGVEDAELVQRRGVDTLMTVARAFEREASHRPLLIQTITDRMFDISGSEPTVPEKAMLEAPCLVIPQEYAQLRCQCLDVGIGASNNGPELGQALVDELSSLAPTPQVALRGRYRWIQQFDERTLAADGGALRRHGVYWITGGLGRVGLRVAEHIARRAVGRLVLVSRSGLPGWRDWQRIDTSAPSDRTEAAAIRSIRGMEAAGAEVWVVRCDVSNSAEMLALADETERRFGRLDGIVHAAGASGRSTVRLIGEIAEGECADHSKAMRDGLRAIGAVAARLRPAICVLTSSNASVLGGIGSIAYTAAHQFQDAFARRQDGVDGVRWMSVNWDGWPSADDELTVANVRTTLDRYVMTPDECSRALDRTLSAHRESRLVVSTGDLLARRREWVSRGWNGSEVAAAVAARPVLDRPPAPPQTELERAVVEVWETVLGISPVGVNDSFFDLGGNSLNALRVVSQLSRVSGTKVALMSIFEAPTPRALAALLGQAPSRSAEVEQSQARGESRRQRRRARVPVADVGRV